MGDEIHPLMTGVVMSCTITLNVQTDELPAPSVAVYFTCVVPNGNVAPDENVETRMVEPQLSVAVGAVHVTTA